MRLRCGLRKKFLEPRVVLGQGQPYRRNLTLPVLRKYSSSDELTPAHSPKANAICERVIGTTRREYPPSAVAQPATQLPRHRIGECLVVRARPLLGGLHREYSLAPAMA
jgi:hypothetical protein